MAERTREDSATVLPATHIDAREEDPEIISRRICNRFHLQVAVLNNRDYDYESEAGCEVLSYIAPSFQARFDNIAAIMDWHELVQMWRVWQQEDHDVHFEVVHCSCDVDQAKGEAALYAEITVTGTLGVMLGGLSEAQWKRLPDGRWVNEFYMGMRGITQNGGFV
ncbi:hypothetical protein Slin15195_G025530 [Septoria linicola]|uniref:SnoaL-like domain-containing protein n=1 Tax=Septoria linicola TaxID=215465 RepID=A0A9Q9AGZ7_9PEZI|nr:hypothetical protein Slin15195_G025530 [Septoria linicola]